MTDSLDENESPIPRDEVSNTYDKGSQKSFWVDGHNDDLKDTEDDGEALPEWLRLSHTVGTYDAQGMSSGTDYAALYPKAQGGRVVVRGPVDGEAPEGEASKPTERPLTHSPMMDDLDEPLTAEEERANEEKYLPSDVYTDENPYDAVDISDSEEGPAGDDHRGHGIRDRLFGRKKERASFAEIWQDVEYEQVAADSSSADMVADEVASTADAADGGEPIQGDGEGELEVVPTQNNLAESGEEDDGGLLAEYQDQAQSGYAADDYLQPTVSPLSDEAFSSFVEGSEEAPYTLEHTSLPEVSPMAASPESLPIIAPDPLLEMGSDEDVEGVQDVEQQVDLDGGQGQDHDASDASQSQEDSKPKMFARVSQRVKGHRPSKRTLIIAGVVCVVLVAVYVAGVVQNTGVFPPNTGIGECDVSGMTQEEAEQALTQQTQGYSLTITAGDFAVIVDGASVSVDRDEPRIAKEAFERQNAFIWPFSYLFHYDPGVDQSITYDNIKFDKRINDAIDDFNKKTLPSSEAKVDYDSNTQMYSLSGTVDGQAVDKEVVLDEAHEAIAFMKSSIKPSQGATIFRPQQRSALRQAEPSDLPQYAQAVNNANTVRNTNIPVLIQGKQVVVCDPLLIRSWVSVSDAPEVVVDTAAMQKWADTTLSQLVYKDGEWGEIFLDTNAFVTTFADRLKNGEPGPVEAVTYEELNREGTSRQQAYEKSPWNKELGRYIDVDLTAQFARLFDKEGNVIWESAFVSGDMYAGHQTVTGTYKMYAHEPGQVLVGLDYNKDGKPDYESYVNFWMPFYGGYGLHDATWRDSFGGDLYMYNGSHGCINLPYDKAKELFDMTSVGDTVYVHE